MAFASNDRSNLPSDWETAPRYPYEMQDEKKDAAIAACKEGRYEDAARFLAESGLAGLFTHYVVRPAAIRTDHLCAKTASYFRETGPSFVWIKTYPSHIDENKVYYIQTGTCGAHQYYAFEIVPNGGFEDEGVST
jgi:hypothetical protein